MRSKDVEGICIFGSAARSSNDQISDRDVLIVSSNISRRIHLTYKWRIAGWSVASYSPRRLEKIISAGSLFVQHLKKEGVFLEDQDNWLENTLRSAEKKESYEADAKRSVLLALPIERFSSKALIQTNLIVSDLAYVALRNFGICYLANRGEMIFDYYRIIESLGGEFGLSPDEMKLVHSLRAGKIAYREGRNYADCPGTVEELRSVLSKFFVHHPLGSIRYNTAVRDLAVGYATLRDFEASVVKEIEGQESTRIQGRGNFEHVRNLIRNPRTYAWDVRNLSQRDLESIRARLTAMKAKSDGCALSIQNTEQLM